MDILRFTLIKWLETADRVMVYARGSGTDFNLHADLQSELDNTHYAILRVLTAIRGQ